MNHVQSVLSNFKVAQEGIVNVPESFALLDLLLVNDDFRDARLVLHHHNLRVKLKLGLHVVVLGHSISQVLVEQRLSLLVERPNHPYHVLELMVPLNLFLERGIVFH